MYSNKTPRRINSNNDAARRRALADATAGVIGSLASVLAFYPVDVWKTSLQAGVVARRDGDATTRGDDRDGDDDEKTIATIASKLRRSMTEGLSRSFRGLPHKIAHTIVSSFAYFFVHSLVQTKYAESRRRLRRRSPLASGGGGGGDDSAAVPPTTSTATKLLLTAFAAVINTCITLPLDTISSRKQAGVTSEDGADASAAGRDTDAREKRSVSSGAPRTTNGVSNRAVSPPGGENADGGIRNRNSCDSSSEYHSANEEEVEEEEAVHGGDDGRASGDVSNHDGVPPEEKRQQLYVKSPEAFRFSFSTDLAREAFATANRARRNNEDARGPYSDAERRNVRRRLRSVLSLWNGLLPSVLLCTNPAIQYTMYDVLKGAAMQRRRGKSATDDGGAALSMWEAFAFGLVSKFAATVATYPLIRCKVMLMVSSPAAFGEEEAKKDGGDNGGVTSGIEGGAGDASRRCTDASSPPTTTMTTRGGKYPRSLLPLMLHIFRKDGVRGIYKGCSLQLLHTILKSAMLMMVREKITFASHRFFRVEE